MKRAESSMFDRWASDDAWFERFHSMTPEEQAAILENQRLLGDELTVRQTRRASGEQLYTPEEDAEYDRWQKAMVGDDFFGEAPAKAP